MSPYISASLTLTRILSNSEAAEILQESRRNVKAHHDQCVRLDMFSVSTLVDYGFIAPWIDWQKTDCNPSDELTPSSLYTNLILARRLLSQTPPAKRKALSLLKKLEPLCVAVKRQADLLDCWVLLAVTHEDLKQRELALRYLEQAISLAQVTGHKRLFLDLNYPIDILLERVAQKYLGHTATSQLGNIGNKLQQEHPPILLTNDPLTRRETDILRLVGRGYSNLEISQNLSISENTTRWHLKNIYRKLNVDNRTKASAYAQKLGILG